MKGTSKQIKVVRKLIAFTLAMAITLSLVIPTTEVVAAATKTQKVTIVLNKTKKIKTKVASTFKSSNKKIVSVSKKGVIKAKKVGNAKITVTSKKDKKVKQIIKVTVIKKAKKTTQAAATTQIPSTDVATTQDTQVVKTIQTTTKSTTDEVKLTTEEPSTTQITEETKVTTEIVTTTETNDVTEEIVTTEEFTNSTTEELVLTTEIPSTTQQQPTTELGDNDVNFEVFTTELEEHKELKGKICAEYEGEQLAVGESLDSTKIKISHYYADGNLNNNEVIDINIKDCWLRVNYGNDSYLETKNFNEYLIATKEENVFVFNYYGMYFQLNVSATNKDNIKYEKEQSKYLELSYEGELPTIGKELNYDNLKIRYVDGDTVRELKIEDCWVNEKEKVYSKNFSEKIKIRYKNWNPIEVVYITDENEVLGDFIFVDAVEE